MAVFALLAALGFGCLFGRSNGVGQDTSELEIPRSLFAEAALAQLNNWRLKKFINLLPKRSMK